MVSLITDSVPNASSTAILKLRAEVEERLRSNAVTQLRDIACEAQGQVIVLRGQVDSFYLKQLAQETIKQLESRAMILNLVAVK